MNLSPDNLQQLSRLAAEAARTAGVFIAENRPNRIDRKKGGQSLASQVVTEIDVQAQEIILKHLEPASREFDLGLLTEETTDNQSRLTKDFFWCIDPLDGTLPFIESTPGYAVSIALVAHSGAPQIGTVFDPVKKNLYHAVRNSGAFRNGTPWKIQPPSPDKPLSLFADRSFSQQPRYSEIMETLNRIAAETGCCRVETDLRSGAVMNACQVLENSPACYFKLPRAQESGGSLWDYAATACLFNEAGAAASDLSGKPLDLNRADSTFMNHCGILFASSPDLAQRLTKAFHDLSETEDKN